MSWLGSLWAWIAAHSVMVAATAIGLLTIAGAVLWVRRARQRDRAAGELLAKAPSLPSRKARRSEIDEGAVPASPVPKRPEQQAFDPASPTGPLRQPIPHGPPTESRPVELSSFSARRPDPSTPQGALEIEAGRLAYQIPRLMWRGVQETVEVRLGRSEAEGLMQGFVGRGSVKTEDTQIVETMSVSLVCEPGAFDIESRSQEVQLVKPDLVKGTDFHQADFAKWVWLVTPRQSGEHTLLVKVSAAIRDSRGLPTTSSLPDKIIDVTVRVHLVRATTGAVGRAVPWLAVTVAGALVSTFTRDYWWPYVRDSVWPAVRAFAGIQ